MRQYHGKSNSDVYQNQRIVQSRYRQRMDESARKLRRIGTTEKIDV